MDYKGKGYNHVDYKGKGYNHVDYKGKGCKNMGYMSKGYMSNWMYRSLHNTPMPTKSLSL